MGNLVARTISDLSKGHIISYYHHVTLYHVSHIISYIISYYIFIYSFINFFHLVLLIFRMELLLLVRNREGHLPKRKELGWIPSLRTWVIGLFTEKGRNLWQGAVLGVKAAEGLQVPTEPISVPLVEFPSKIWSVWGLPIMASQPLRWGKSGFRVWEFGQPWQRILTRISNCTLYVTNHMSGQNLPNFLGIAILLPFDLVNMPSYEEVKCH